MPHTSCTGPSPASHSIVKWALTLALALAPSVGQSGRQASSLSVRFSLPPAPLQLSGGRKVSLCISVYSGEYIGYVSNVYTYTYAYVFTMGRSMCVCAAAGMYSSVAQALTLATPGSCAQATTSTPAASAAQGLATQSRMGQMQPQGCKPEVLFSHRC